jgi:hypothetical protein
MKVRELLEVLKASNQDAEVRVGDQLEAGPYANIPVGGVYLGSKSEVIICADPDAPMTDEPTGVDHDLPWLWKPPLKVSR